MNGGWEQASFHYGLSTGRKEGFWLGIAIGSVSTLVGCVIGIVIAAHTLLR